MRNVSWPNSNPTLPIIRCSAAAKLTAFTSSAVRALAKYGHMKQSPYSAHTMVGLVSNVSTMGQKVPWK